MAEVEIHWQIIGSILSGHYLTRAGNADAAEIGVVLAIGLLIIVRHDVAEARWTALLLLGLLAALTASPGRHFVRAACCWTRPIRRLQRSCSTTRRSTCNHYVSERQRPQVSDAFGRYVSPVLVQRLAKDATRLQLGGETKDMSILFCDIRGFTQISERFKGNPQGLASLINRFLTPLSRR